MTTQEMIADIWPLALIVFGSIASFIVAYLTHKSAAWVDVQNNEIHDAVIDSAIHNAIAFAQEGQSSSDMRNEGVQGRIADIAFNYVKGHAAQALAARKIDDKILMEKIRARMAPSIMAAHASGGPITVAAAATMANPNIPTVPIEVEQ